MDTHYDTEDAAKQLEILALDRYNSAHSGVQLSRIVSVATSYEASTNGNVWKLVEKTGSQHQIDYQEVTARFQGIVYQHSLPPFTDRVGRNSPQARYLRQSVMIGGMGTPTFERAVNAVMDIHESFSRIVGQGRMNDCEMVILHSDTNSLALQVSNRYFSSRTGAESFAAIKPLPEDIDPHGYLAQAAGPDLYYGEENEVEYFAREGRTDSDYIYAPTKPMIFSVGDIVEAQVSFATIPLKGGRFKTTMILRGLTLIDGSFSRIAKTRRGSTRTEALRSKKNIRKRKADYQEELLSITQARIDQIHISNYRKIECRRQTKNRESDEDEFGSSTMSMQGMD